MTVIVKAGALMFRWSNTRYIAEYLSRHGKGETTVWLNCEFSELMLNISMVLEKKTIMLECSDGHREK